jgi:hypothetical protein
MNPTPIWHRRRNPIGVFLVLHVFVVILQEERTFDLSLKKPTFVFDLKQIDSSKVIMVGRRASARFVRDTKNDCAMCTAALSAIQ